MSTKNIVIEELKEDLPAMDLKNGDYVAMFPMNFYSGAGIYGIEDTTGGRRLARCIETLNGKIQLCDIGTANSRTVTPEVFKKIVIYKLFARVTIDNNLPATAVSELREILRGE